MSIAESILRSAGTLSERLAVLSFEPTATHVYNPLEYALAPFSRYLCRFADSRKKVIFLGMNPGPFGMAQTGVAFGEVAAVRDWMGIFEPVGKPHPEHPRRPVDGFACPRSEVSGRRLWGLFAEEFGTPEVFFQEHLVLNYCPLLFLDGSGKGCRNLTPDKLPAAQSGPLFDACDAHLREVVTLLQPAWLVGVGQFAAKRAEAVLAGMGVQVTTILHPSPASPLANRGWGAQARQQLVEAGIW